MAKRDIGYGCSELREPCWRSARESRRVRRGFLQGAKERHDEEFPSVRLGAGRPLLPLTAGRAPSRDWR